MPNSIEKIGHKFSIIPGAFTVGLGYYAILITLPHLCQMRQIAVVIGQFLKPVLRNMGGENNGISATGLPFFGIDAPKQFYGVLVPAPPQIA